MATIYFATNRNPNNAQTPTDFGKGFSDTSLGDLRFGQVKVKRGTLDPNSIRSIAGQSRPRIRGFIQTITRIDEGSVAGFPTVYPWF